MNEEDKKKFWDWLSFLVFYVFFIGFSAIFYAAYFTPGKSFTIYINFFGEADLEYFLMLGLLVAGFRVLISKTLELYKHYKSC